MKEIFLTLHNGQPKKMSALPVLSFDDFRARAMNAIHEEARIIALWGYPLTEVTTMLIMMWAHDKGGYVSACGTRVKESYDSLSNAIPQVHWFERELYEQWHVRPLGHPWLKPIRFHVPHRETRADGLREPLLPSVTDFMAIQGNEVHEVAVGPVHAGIIEPGHFRFQCHGEQVFHLEISLGYQHRGIEKAVIGGPHARTIHYMETASGDTTIGHALAYAHAIEGLAGCEVTFRAAVLRSIMLELERLANHTGDLGALAGDIGYLPTASYCGRLRGDFLNMTALVCGNRFGRTMIRPGGVMFDIDNTMREELQRRLADVFSDVSNAISLLWSSALVVDRFDETGVITKKMALDLGLVGVAARACGLEQDVRFDFPTGAFRFSQIPVSTYSSGDVFARAFVRWLEIQRSVEFIREQLNALPDGALEVPLPPMQGEQILVSLVEGWRGEIAHCVLTDKHGRIAQYKIVDPSFHNWMGLAMALRGEEISNFPLCNKSFNLSYCGHDL